MGVRAVAGALGFPPVGIWRRLILTGGYLQALDPHRWGSGSGMRRKPVAGPVSKANNALAGVNTRIRRGKVVVRRAGSSILGRIVSVLMTATGVNALLFAALMGNLSALSSSFGERKDSVLIIGVAGLILGFTVNVFSARRDLVPKGRIGRSERILINGAIGLFGGWLAFAVIVYAVQDQLLFSPRPVSSSRLERIAREFPGAEALEILASDGATLRGWLVPPLQFDSFAPQAPGTAGNEETPGAIGDGKVDGSIGGSIDAPGGLEDMEVPVPIGESHRSPLVIVFAGQGGEASSYLDLSRRLPEMAWAFVNYRGYGASDGTPSDKALFDDALAVYDHLLSRPDVDGGNVFAMGGSLGTGVATYLASQRPVAGVILFSPYDRIGGGVARDMMPWVPTKWLFRNGFDASSYAPLVRAPALAVIGGEDLVIRPERSRRLLRQWGGGHRLVVIPDGDHFSIYDDDGAWRTIQGFVRGLVN